MKNQQSYSWLGTMELFFGEAWLDCLSPWCEIYPLMLYVYVTVNQRSVLMFIGKKDLCVFFRSNSSVLKSSQTYKIPIISQTGHNYRKELWFGKNFLFFIHSVFLPEYPFWTSWQSQFCDKFQTASIKDEITLHVKNKGHSTMRKNSTTQ